MFRPQGFNGPPRFPGAPQAPGFGGFRMQIRPGGFPNGAPAQAPVPDLKPTNESGLLFISNIDDNCPNDLLKEILESFGKVEKWTRIQGADGNYPPFGFCGYEESSSAVMAILTLNNFCIGTRRLNVKPDEKAKQKLVDFVVNDRIAKQLPRKALGKELTPDEGDRDEIKGLRVKVREMLLKHNSDLVYDNDDDLNKDDEKKVEEESSKSSKHKKRSSSRSKKKKHRSKKRSRSKSRSRSPSTHKRSRSKSLKVSKKRRRSASSSRSSSVRRESTPEDHINGLDSNDSDVALERKERKRENRRKDEEYLRELKKFEERERRMAKQFAKEEENDQNRKKTLQREAKKLDQFLEEYEDERDDPKYYSGSMYNKRKRDYEIEQENDDKDRNEESKEIEAIKAMILAENKKVGKQNGNLTTVKTNGKPSGQLFRNSFVEEKATPSETDQFKTESNEWTPAYDNPSTSQQEPNKKVITTFQSKILSQVNNVFADDETEEDRAQFEIKKKIKPFEITAQDRIESMTQEERKQMIKELIEAIPTNKETLFDYKISWDQLDDELIEQRIKPWVEKKIHDYIGDDEPSLVSFICERVTTHSEPARLLGDLAMILDDEAESFIIKLWRLIIFQTEAKKVGLNVNGGKP